MWLELLAILIGFLLLAWSADRLVKGASAIAVNLNVAPLIIGLTIVGMGTSAPEMIVSGMAAWQGNPGLASGNAVGSNIINIALILGLTALITPLHIHSSIIRRELPVLMIAMIAAGVLLSDGTLGRLDGALLLAGMVILLGWAIWLTTRARGRSDPMAAEFAGEMPVGISMRRALLLLVSGSLVLLASSRLLVWAAVSIAQTFGVSDLVIGLTIVAFGTSLPELAACLASALRREHDITVGNVVGSNIFNTLAVLGLPGLIHPAPVEPLLLTRDYPFMLVITLLLFIMAYGFRSPGRLNRLEGGLLVGTFCAYQTLLYFSEISRIG